MFMRRIALVRGAWLHRYRHRVRRDFCDGDDAMIKMMLAAFIAFQFGMAVEAVGKAGSGGTVQWWFPFVYLSLLVTPAVLGYWIGKSEINK